MFKRILVFLSLLTVISPVFAVGATIVAALGGAAVFGAFTMAAAMAINMVVAMIITKAFSNQPSFDQGTSSQSENPGNRQQVPPATDNKLPVLYGSAYIGGTVTDLSISSNNQEMYYVLSICEVTNSGPTQVPDQITFGKIYFGGKRVVFQSNGYTVLKLIDESTGIEDTTVNGKIEFFLYKNGSYSPTNSPFTAIEVMNRADLTYKWDSLKLMTNCAFAILHLSYSQSANIRGLEATKFQLTNSRSNTGDCFYDYLTNTRYGCAIPTNQIDTTSLADLTTYSNGSFAYTDSDGNPATQARFKFNGTLDTNNTVMANLQNMATCCDCLIKYNEITAKWGVIVQKPDYATVMNITDSNMISAISITPLDIAASYNVIECKFPDNSNQDAFNSSTFDLAQIDPALLYPNEPVNKVSLSLPLVNNDVTAQYIANRTLKAGREDLQVQVSVNFEGIQLDAGDIVALTSVNYGWTNKPFRINKVVQQFNDDGSIGVQLNMSEYNATVYDDVSVTQFQPAPNTGIGDPTFFGVPPVPVVIAQYPTNTNPIFVVQVTTAPAGITQYAEVWYSAYSNPLETQMYFAGTSEIQSNGAPWNTNTVLPSISLSIPSGNWYLFTRMVNNLASSAYSPASSLFEWRPSTIQYTNRYLMIAYADSIAGSGFNLNPRGKTYYGLFNQNSTNPVTDVSAYTWYLAEPNFGTTYYLCYSNRTGRKISLATGLATIAGGSGAFVPLQANLFDPSIWSALPDGTSYIDLDQRTGQLIETGTTTVGTGEIAVTNNPDGKVIAALQPFLNFGAGVYTYTGSAATITVDIYGRVVGFTAPDNFYYTKQSFTATSGQTVFTPTSRAANYITGQDFVFVDGVLLTPTSDYTETSTNVTLINGANVGSIVTIISFRSIASSTSSAYASFTRNTVSLTGASSYTASGFTLNSGYEFLFINGVALSDSDYDIIGQTITNFPSPLTGNLTIIQWSQNNLGVPNGTPVNQSFNPIVGQVTYTFSFDPLAFNLYDNGLLLLQGVDYTVATNSYTLTNSPTTVSSILQQQTFARTGPA